MREMMGENTHILITPSCTDTATQHSPGSAGISELVRAACGPTALGIFQKGTTNGKDIWGVT